MLFASCRYCVVTGIAVGLSVLFWGSSSEAAPLIGDSSAYGVSVDLSLDVDAGLIEIVSSAGVGPTPTISGSAPSPYNNVDTLASASAGASLNLLDLVTVEVIDFNTGILDVQAQSDITGADVLSSASGQSSVDNISLDISNANLLGLTSSLVSLQATEIDAMAQVSGQSGALTPTGSATLTGTAGDANNQVALTVLGTEFLLEANPAPNTAFTIDSSLGGALASLQGSIGVFLNEQITSGDEDIDVNALRLAFTDVGVELDLGLSGTTTAFLNGDVIISNAEASMVAAVPEPASMFLVGGGLLGMAFAGRRRRCRQELAA